MNKTYWIVEVEGEPFETYTDESVAQEVAAQIGGTVVTAVANVDFLQVLGNPLTPYGLLVRALRIAARTSLMEMSKATGELPSYLSGVELGRNPLGQSLITRTQQFFSDKGIPVTVDLLRVTAGQGDAP